MHARNLAVAVLTAVFAVSCAPKAQENGPDSQPSAAQTQTNKEIKTDMDILKNPSKAVEKAPENFKVKFETTKGDFTLEVTRDWAPLGADRFYNLVKAGFFTDVAFFRVIEGFMVQFGIHGTPVPKFIGKTESHGCIRLTNWSAAEVAAVVAAGTAVVLQE